MASKALTTADRQFLRDAVSDIKARCHRVALDIIQIGNKLIACRNLLPSGQWSSWVEKNLGWTPQKCRQYVKAANAFSKAKTRTINRIEGQALLSMVRIGVPQSAIDAAIRKAERQKKKLETKQVLRLIENRLKKRPKMKMRQSGSCISASFYRLGATTRGSVKINMGHGRNLVFEASENGSRTCAVKIMTGNRILWQEDDPELKGVIEAFNRATRKYQLVQKRA